MAGTGNTAENKCHEASALKQPAFKYNELPGRGCEHRLGRRENIKTSICIFYQFLARFVFYICVVILVCVI